MFKWISQNICQISEKSTRDVYGARGAKKNENAPQEEYSKY